MPPPSWTSSPFITYLGCHRHQAELPVPQTAASQDWCLFCLVSVFLLSSEAARILVPLTRGLNHGYEATGPHRGVLGSNVFMRKEDQALSLSVHTEKSLEHWKMVLSRSGETTCLEIECVALLLLAFTASETQKRKCLLLEPPTMMFC